MILHLRANGGGDSLATQPTTKPQHQRTSYAHSATRRINTNLSNARSARSRTIFTQSITHAHAHTHLFAACPATGVAGWNVVENTAAHKLRTHANARALNYVAGDPTQRDSLTHVRESPRGSAMPCQRTERPSPAHLAHTQPASATLCIIYVIYRKQHTHTCHRPYTQTHVAHKTMARECSARQKESTRMQARMRWAFVNIIILMWTKTLQRRRRRRDIGQVFAPTHRA